MNGELETSEQRIKRLHVEIGQFRIVNRNHADYCAREIARREREIEILYEAEQKRDAKNTDNSRENEVMARVTPETLENAPIALYSVPEGGAE